MEQAQDTLHPLKERMRAAWVAGDFGQIARYTAKAAEEFVDRLQIAPGTKVLDVACGTGNLAIPAARGGAQVTGADIAPNLLEQARKRTADEGLTATFDEGDAEQLPYPDGSFDLVMTMFGAMFAPRPEVTAAELARVCRSGGRIAMANWTPDSLPAKMFRLTAHHVPPPPGIAPPALWGDDVKARERLGPYVSQITTTRRTITFAFPFSPHETVEFFRDYFGPTKTAFERLDASSQGAYSSDLEAMWVEANEMEDGGTTLLHTDYLEVIATRA